MGVVEGKLLRVTSGMRDARLNWPKQDSGWGRSRRSNITWGGLEMRTMVKYLGVIRCQGWGIWLNWLSRVLAKTRHMNTPESNPVEEGSESDPGGELVTRAGVKCKGVSYGGLSRRGRKHEWVAGWLNGGPLPRGRGGAGMTWRKWSWITRDFFQPSCQPTRCAALPNVQPVTWWA